MEESTESTNNRSPERHIHSKKEMLLPGDIWPGMGWGFFFFKVNKDTGLKRLLEEPNSYEQTW